MNVRHTIFFLVLLLAAFIVAGSNKAVLSEPQATKSPPAKQAEDKDESLPPVLSPDKFFGPAAMGYAAAKGCPHICHNLFCYCGCDITDNHKCLLDCFTGPHGADCHICQEEAMLALRMKRADESMGAIQKAIDEAYSSKYPFKEESAALKHYKSVRKWQPGSSQKATSHAEDGSTCCGDR